jgi:hypothetical protein
LLIAVVEKLLVYAALLMYITIKPAMTMSADIAMASPYASQSLWPEYSYTGEIVVKTTCDCGGLYGEEMLGLRIVGVSRDAHDHSVAEGGGIHWSSAEVVRLSVMFRKRSSSMLESGCVDTSPGLPYIPGTLEYRSIRSC